MRNSSTLEIDILEVSMSKFDRSCNKVRATLVEVWGAQSCAVKAFDLGRECHRGIRRDGVTPEFAHSLLVGTNLFNIRDWLIYPEESVATGFIHDGPEDYPKIMTYGLILNLCGERVANSAHSLNKRHKGKLIPKHTYFGNMEKDPITSIVKPADTYNNFETIGVVFDAKNQLRHIRKAAKYLLPMIHNAKHEFKEQAQAYRLYEFLLKRDIVLLSRNLKIKSPILSEVQRMF